MMEKLIEYPRHLDIQLLADQHGSLVLPSPSSLFLFFIILLFLSLLFLFLLLSYYLLLLYYYYYYYLFSLFILGIYSSNVIIVIMLLCYYVIVLLRCCGITKTMKKIAMKERERTIQKGYQTVLGESPSTFITPDIRQQIADQAIAIGKAVGLTNAATVEILIDPDRNFYFLELNPTFSPLHSLSEMVSSVDIVEHLIRSSSSLPLSLSSSPPLLVLFSFFYSII